jgi:hypothetical protein
VKGSGLVLGLGAVGVVAAAAYFIAKGKAKPAANNAAPAPKKKGIAAAVPIATGLLTSQNISAIGGLFGSGTPATGAVKPDTVKNYGLVTEADIAAPQTAQPDYTGEFVTSVD